MNKVLDIVRSLPESPGVYQYFDKDGTVIYVGKAKNLKRRVSSYFRSDVTSMKTRNLVKHIADLKYVVVDSEQDAFLLENNLIKKYQPHYNILLKDGKTYPMICITREDYPRIIKTRQRDRKSGEYFGPYSVSGSADLVLEIIHRLYPIRTCSSQMSKQSVSAAKTKVCLKYHIHRCCGICEQKVSNEEYASYIEDARQIIRGNAHDIIGRMSDEIRGYSERMEYEKAAEVKRRIDLLRVFQSKTVITATNLDNIDVFGYCENDNHVYINILHLNHGSITQGQTIEYTQHIEEEAREEILAHGIVELREQIGSHAREIIVPFLPEVFDENVRVYIANTGDKKRVLDLAMKNAQQYMHDRIVQADKLNPEQRQTRILKQLQETLHLTALPEFIDTFDNSNLQGTNAVSACVVFRRGKPSKSEYKKFIVETVTGQDDYASMREIVRRRYQRILDEKGELPSLILADGGKGQMSAIREVIERQLGLEIPVAGLKKDSHHRTNTLLYGDPVEEVSLPVTSELFQMLTKIQDEVHRFAITFHKQKRSKSQINSQLNDIQGVGPTTRQRLLQHFHSVARIISATEEELAEVVGKSRGSIVYGYFHGKISQ